MKQPPKYGTHGRALRAFRDAAGIRQEDVCEIIGRGSYQWVGDLECGRRGLYELSPVDLGRLEEVTEVEAGALRGACMEAFAARHPWGAEMLRSRHARKGAPMVDGTIDK